MYRELKIRKLLRDERNVIFQRKSVLRRIKRARAPIRIVPLFFPEYTLHECFTKTVLSIQNTVLILYMLCYHCALYCPVCVTCSGAAIEGVIGKWSFVPCKNEINRNRYTTKNFTGISESLKNGLVFDINGELLSPLFSHR